MWLSHYTLVAVPLPLLPTAACCWPACAGALLACLRWGIAGLAHDLPAGVQSLLTEFTAAESRNRRGFAAVFLVALLGAIFIATFTWIDGVHASSFLQAYGMALATGVAFCLIDLVVVDWLVVCFLRPAWVVIRGTEQAAGWGDYGFHVREQLSLRGLAAMFGLPLVIAAAAVGVRAIM